MSPDDYQQTVADAQKKLADLETRVNHLRNQNMELIVADQIPQVDPETMKQLESRRISILSALEITTNLVNALKAMTPAKLRTVMPSANPDPILAALLIKQAQVQQELSTFKRDFGDQHPKVIQGNSELKSLTSQIDERIEAIFLGLDIKAKTMQSELRAWTTLIDENNRRSQKEAEKWRPYILAKRDLENQKKVLESLTVRQREEVAFKTSSSIEGSDIPNAVPGESGSTLSANSIRITLNPALRHVRLKDALDAIVQVANTPINYQIVEYGVVLSSGKLKSPGAR